VLGIVDSESNVSKLSFHYAGPTSQSYLPFHPMPLGVTKFC